MKFKINSYISVLYQLGDVPRGVADLRQRADAQPQRGAGPDQVHLLRQDRHAHQEHHEGEGEERAARHAHVGRLPRGDHRRHARHRLHLGGQRALRPHPLLRRQGPARARLLRPPQPQGPRGRRRPRRRHRPHGRRHEAGEGAAGGLRRHRRPRPADQGERRAAPHPPGVLRGDGHQAAQGRHPLRPVRHGQDAPGQGGHQPHLRHLPARRQEQGEPKVPR